MPTCKTKFHGTITFEPQQVLQVPDGIFGFPDEREFLLLELPSARPLVFVQSVRSSALCFIALPAQVIEPDYQLSLAEGSSKALGYPAGHPPLMGKDLLCLSFLVMGDKQANANLLAPLVIDIASHRGMQVIVNGPYSHQHPVSPSRFHQGAD